MPSQLVTFHVYPNAISTVTETYHFHTAKSSLTGCGSLEVGCRLQSTGGLSFIILRFVYVTTTTRQQQQKLPVIGTIAGKDDCETSSQLDVRFRLKIAVDTEEQAFNFIPSSSRIIIFVARPGIKSLSTSEAPWVGNKTTLSVDLIPNRFRREAAAENKTRKGSEYRSLRQFSFAECLTPAS